MEIFTQLYFTSLRDKKLRLIDFYRKIVKEELRKIRQGDYRN